LLDIRFSIAGFFVGSLIGLTGMGGGALMTPILILLLSVKPITAVGTDLAYAALTKIIGVITHYKQNTVDLKVAGYLILGGMPASVIGVHLLYFMRRDGYMIDEFIKTALGFILIIVATFVLFQIASQRRNWKDTQIGLYILTRKTRAYKHIDHHFRSIIANPLVILL